LQKNNKINMGKIISILNHKGGVGKTTTAVNLGAGLARKGKKVLFIDCDGQANLTESLGVYKTEKTLYEAMRGECKLPIIKNEAGYELVPSSLDLSAVEIELNNEVGREYILSELLKPISYMYDYVIIDCPPSLGLLTVNALTASNSVIVPLQSQYLALRGIDKLMSILEKVKQRLNKNIEIAGVLITLYSSNKNLDKMVIETVKAMFDTDIFNTCIRTNTQLAEAPAAGKDIFSYAPKSNGAIDYENFVNEILKK
jgi:chromosome partitioning protein